MYGIGTEAAVFLCAGLSGMSVMFAWQMLSCFRKAIPHSGPAVAAGDILFWLGVSAYLFRQMYVTTFGSIRWYFVLGTAAGILAAYFVVILLKKVVLKMKKKLEKFKENR